MAGSLITIEVIPTLSKAPHHLKKDFGELNLGQGQQKEVRGILLAGMAKLRFLLGQSTKSIHEHCRDERKPPCATCAFNQQTDREAGFMETVYGLMKAIMLGPEELLFMCHHAQGDAFAKSNLIDRSKLAVCNGYSLVMALHQDEAEQIAHATIAALRAYLSRGS